MNADAIVEQFHQQRASAILRTPYAEAVQPAMSAAVDGGFRFVEFTLNTPGALEAIATFAADSRLIVGAGTVMTPEQVDQAIDAGARFIVSPIVDEAVIEQTLRRDAVAMPGCSTPTELMRAARAGAQLQKVFPAPAGGASFARACLGPMPELKLVPTSGVDADNVADWFAAGAWAVGFVAPLFVDAWLREGQFDRVRERAELLLRAAG